MCMRQNVYLCGKAAICSCFGAICGKKECVLVQNGVRFASKWRAFWYKMECDLMLNGVRFGAKRKAKCR